jgi:hypothetical protein
MSRDYGAGKTLTIAEKQKKLAFTTFHLEEATKEVS